MNRWLCWKAHAIVLGLFFVIPAMLGLISLIAAVAPYIGKITGVVILIILGYLFFYQLVEEALSVNKPHKE
jgi:hypothetical protein